MNRNIRASEDTAVSAFLPFHVRFLWTVSIPRFNISTTDPECLISADMNRRRFVVTSSAGIAALLAPRKSGWAHTDLPHPTPRPGVTGEHVLTHEQLADSPKLIPLFDSVRKIPEVMDGIRCNCGCTEPPLLRSL